MKQLYTAAMYETILVNIVTDLLKQSGGKEGKKYFEFWPVVLSQGKC